MRVRLTVLILAALLALALCSCQDVRSPTQQAADWWPPSQRSTAECIIHFESGGDPHAHSPGYQNLGALQINSVHRGDFERLTGKSWLPNIYNPVLNGEYGYHLWLSTGWHAWSTHTRCHV